MTRTLRRTYKAATLAIAAFTLSASSVSAQTLSLPDNDTPTWGLGKGATATMGQTFFAPTGYSVLQSFSFWLSNDPGLALNPTALSFQAFVMQWDAANGHATGPVLYTSAAQSGPTAFSQRYNFVATNTLLDPSLQYVAFLSASPFLGNITPTDANAVLETSLLGTYTGGGFVFFDNGTDFAALSNTTWDYTGDPSYQTRFEAKFTNAAVSVVPEPSSIALLVSGLAAILVVAVKRKRV